MVYIWTKFIQNLQSHVAALRRPGACLLCDGPADTAHALCSACQDELPWLGPQCSVCALPLPAAGLTCAACLRRPPSFARVEAPWRYAFPVDALVTRFKHQSAWPFGRLLGALLAEHLRHAHLEGLPRPELLLPVPLARARLRRRGFNQAALLVRWLGEALRIEVREDLVLRPQDTAAQQGLDAAARRRNLRGAFALVDAQALAGRHVALVDDVLTTGATAEALARLLRRAGATRVDVYCLARTPAPD